MVSENANGYGSGLARSAMSGHYPGQPDAQRNQAGKSNGWAF